MRIALALVVACCGCQAIDDFDFFRVVTGDGGAVDLYGASDLARASTGDGGAGDLSGAIDLTRTPDDRASAGDATPPDDGAATGDGGVSDLSGASDLTRSPDDGAATGPDLTVGPCDGGGVCVPNAMRQANCDVCSQQVCGDNCQWSVCQLKLGNACREGEGRPCQNPGVCSGSHMCKSCQWPARCCG